MGGRNKWDSPQTIPFISICKLTIYHIQEDIFFPPQIVVILFLNSNPAIYIQAVFVIIIKHYSPFQLIYATYYRVYN